MDTLSVEKYVVTPSSKDFMQEDLHVQFGDFVVIDQGKIDKLKNAAFVSIDLVYTAYPKEEDFAELNRKRIEYLHLILPEAFQNPGVKWRIIAQTKCESSNAKNLFHGFHITYRPGASLEMAAKDSDYITRIFKGEIKSQDSLVLKVFQRNKFKEAALVADFTGSMSPYVGQIFSWYEMTFETGKFKAFCFFNDGDKTPDMAKVKGSTGGIYFSKNTEKKYVYECAQKCIDSGYGGDAQENDVEAILATIEKHTDIKEVVLLADNLAPLRDLSLADKIKIPVRVVLCGANYGIVNPQFLELAYITKGSVHTMEEDITNLSKLTSGSKITIGTSKFTFNNGRFTPVKGS